jgi:hypothetical protein
MRERDVAVSSRRSALLVEKSLQVVVKLIQLSSLPLMRPLRRQAIEIPETGSSG